MDISIEAIESELAVAQANAGRPMEHAAFARAQIIATLMAGMPTALSDAVEFVGERVGPVYDVDDSTPWHEKIELAAKILGLHPSVVADALINPTERYSPPLEDQPADPGEDPDDDDEDFFAEARKGKK